MKKANSENLLEEPFLDDDLKLTLTLAFKDAEKKLSCHTSPSMVKSGMVSTQKTPASPGLLLLPPDGLAGSISE